MTTEEAILGIELDAWNQAHPPGTRMRFTGSAVKGGTAIMEITAPAKVYDSHYAFEGTSTTASRHILRCEARLVEGEWVADGLLRFRERACGLCHPLLSLLEDLPE